jgi:formamidopyrimidine-DNA glycosylase
MSNIINDLPLRVEAIDTKGKFMWWTLKGQDKTWYMWCTYGMSGQWSRTSGKHTAFIVEYNGSGDLGAQDQQKLFFNDTRRFGTIKFISNLKKHEAKLASLGPDVLADPTIEPEIFAKRVLQKPNRTIAEALMDQSRVAGIGNYIKSEALLRAGISPWRNVTDITSEEYVNLCQSVLDVATESYKSQGASIKTYRNVDDSKGTTQFNFKIYSKKVCPIGHPVINETTTDGRTSWWCKDCQK